MSVHAISVPDVRQQVHDAARRARAAAYLLASLPTVAKDQPLCVAADAIVANTDRVLAANAEDLQVARAANTSTAMIDRLALDAKRVEGIAAGLRQGAGLPDPGGEGRRCASTAVRAVCSGWSTRAGPTSPSMRSVWR